MRVRASQMIVVGVALSVLVVATPLVADNVFWETGELLGSLFPDAARVTYERIDLADADVAAIERATEEVLERRDWIIFVALDASENVLGYAVFDEQMGQHQPITFAVQIDPSGVVVRQELVVYREPFGDEVSSERFRAQFAGHGPGADYDDIVTVSGATISSQAMRVGVRRVVEMVARVLSARPGDLLARAELSR